MTAVPKTVSPPGPQASPPEKKTSMRADPAVARLETLLQLEADSRRCQTLGELRHHVTHDTRALMPFRQAVLLERDRQRWRVSRISSVSVVDTDSPFVRAIEALVEHRIGAGGLKEPTHFTLASYEAEKGGLPFREALWMPLERSDGVFAGLLMLSERAWRTTDDVLALRLAETYTHAWTAFSSSEPRRWRKWFGLWPAALAALLAVSFIPVPLTTLAPATAIAQAPFIVTAPIDGVVSQVLVEPNAMVEKGALLVALDDTELRGQSELAEKRMNLAQASLLRARQSALVDPTSRRDLAVAEGEWSLARAERDFAQQRLAKVEIRAPRAGLAVFNDPDDWKGRPVGTGQRIMEIADPKDVKLLIEVPVNDAIALNDNAKIRVFFDADPLRPLTARLIDAAFHAMPVDGGGVAYRVTARLDDPRALPRIGSRGTAQLQGSEVALWFYLLRRPLSFMRQTFGL